MIESEISGTVTDATTGDPLAGANVYIEHTTIGTITSIDGKYAITKVPPGEFHLVVTYMGYQPGHEEINIEAGQELTMDFSLRSSVLEMGTVVITGTGTPHLFEDMPVRTSVIPRRVIEQNQSCNLAEALSFATGVRVENDCQNCNFSQVRILGMDGKYSQVLIDGDPVFSSLAGVYGLEQIPEEMIDQIEIVKGGGSSLYGGGAVAGVINLRLRRPITNQVRLKSTTTSHKGDVDQRLGITAEFMNSTGTSGGFVFGSGRQRNPFDYNDDGYSELGKILNESFGFNWFFKPIENGELTTHIHRIHENRRGGNKFHMPNHEAQLSEALESWRWGGTVKWQHRPSTKMDYSLFYSFALQDRLSYYGGLGTETPVAADSAAALAAYGTTKNPLHMAGLQTNIRLGNQIFTGGVQYKHEHLDDKATANPLYYIENTYTNFGVFLQDNFHFGSRDQIEFIVGARMDKHSEIENAILSPRFNAKFGLGDDWTLRAAYTTGFKAPQVYDEDLHLCGIAGDQHVHRNADDLKPERSQSFSGGIDFNHAVNGLPVMFGVTGFYTLLTDAFSAEEVGTIQDVTYFERVNAGEAFVRGVELDFGIRPFPALELRSGWTFKKSEYDETVDVLEDDDGNVIATTKKFLRTPDSYGYVWASLNLAKGFNCFASANYTGKMDVTHEGERVIKTSDSFLELDLGMSIDIGLASGVKGRITAGIKNITDSYQQDLDVGVERDPAYVYGPTRPRTLYFGIESIF